MGRKNQNAFIKRKKAEQKKKKQKEKLEKKEARKKEPSSGKLEDMLAYLDKNGNITDVPPEDQ